MTNVSLTCLLYIIPTHDSEWYCSKCKSFSKSTTQTSLETLPPILIIHFKRFDYDPQSYVYIDTFIDFPSIFKPGKYISQKPIEMDYELIAVCLRQGSLRGGHAYAYAKLKHGKWYCFNDSSSSPIHETDVLRSRAFILVYRRSHYTDIKHDLHYTHDQKYD